jgi:hypothetical protein
MNKNYVTEQALTEEMNQLLLKEVSPDHSRHLSMTGASVLALTRSLYKIQLRGVLTIYNWMILERPSQFDTFEIDGIITQTAIPVGILLNEKHTDKLILCQREERQLALELDAFKSAERETLAYRSTLADAFSMSVDFLRTCGAYLPQEIFPPHALASRIVCKKGIRPAVALAQDKKLLVVVPESLYSMSLALRGIISLQRIFRGGKKTIRVKDEGSKPVFKFRLSLTSTGSRLASAANSTVVSRVVSVANSACTTAYNSDDDNDNDKHSISEEDSQSQGGGKVIDSSRGSNAGSVPQSRMASRSASATNTNTNNTKVPNASHITKKLGRYVYVYV